MKQQAVQLWREAEQALSAGDLAKATRLYNELTPSAEMAPHAHLRLSLMADQRKSLRDATAEALKAMDAAYPDPDLLTMLCKRLLVVGEHLMARGCAVLLMQRSKPNAGHCAELGKLMSDHMEVDVALPLLQRAASLGLANSAAIRYLIGLNAMYIGENARAQAELERALELEPGFHLAYWTLSKLGNAAGRSNRISAITALLADLPERHPDAPILGYSLFHELDAQDEAERAWPVLATAMQRRRHQVQHDSNADDLLHASIESAWRDLAAPDASDIQAESTPIFVVGMPRTGTTLVDRELSRATGATSVGELRDFFVQMRWMADLSGPWSLDQTLISNAESIAMPELGQRYVSHTDWRSLGASYYTDKWPDNYKVAGWIRSSIRDARIVSVHRDPMDACFSNLKEWFAGAYAYSYDIHETAKQYARYEKLLEAYHRGAPRLSARVRYEDLVANPADTIDELTVTLGLENNVAETARTTEVPVKTASAVQVREGIHGRNVGSWKRYASQLAPMQEALEKAGYSTSSDAER